MLERMVEDDCWCWSWWEKRSFVSREKKVDGLWKRKKRLVSDTQSARKRRKELMTGKKIDDDGHQELMSGCDGEDEG